MSLEAENQLEHICRLRFDGACQFRRLTGIICTVAAASRDEDILTAMMKAGMNIVRLNMSHDTHDFHALTIHMVRLAAETITKELGYNRHLGIAVDLKGPRVSTGIFENNHDIELRSNDNIRVTVNKDLMDKCNRECIYVDYPNVINVVVPGNRIYINDGAVVLLVKEIAVDCLICLIERGGWLSSRKSVTLPGVPVDLPAVSEKDRYDLKFAVDHNVDFVFASSLRDASAIREIRTVLGDKGKDIKILAKIESVRMLHQLDELLLLADGIVLCRGDIGIELPAERIFLVQKAIIARCNRVGKPIVLATQLMQSMRKHWAPKRAEVHDLGNALLDGADAFMLSGETAVGLYPVESTAAMAAVLREAESAMWYRNLFEDLLAHNPGALDAAHAVAISAVDAAHKSLATGIIVLTTSGRSANLISKYRPRCPIFAVTRCSKSARQAHLYRGVIPVLYTEPLSDSWAKNVDERVQYALIIARRMNFIAAGDAVVVVSPWKEGYGFTNNMRLVYAFFEQEDFECLLKKDQKLTKQQSGTKL